MPSPYGALSPHSPPIDRLAPDLRETVARFRVEPEQGPSVDLVLDHGRLTVQEVSGDADCELKCPGNQLRRLLNGEANLLTAFLRGDVQIKKGSLELAKRLYRYLRAAREKGACP